jgi:hypothetical protein
MAAGSSETLITIYSCRKKIMSNSSTLNMEAVYYYYMFITIMSPSNLQKEAKSSSITLVTSTRLHDFSSQKTVIFTLFIPLWWLYSERSYILTHKFKGSTCQMSKCIHVRQNYLMHRQVDRHAESNNHSGIDENKMRFDWAHSFFSPGAKDNHHDLSKHKFLLYSRRFNAYLIGEDLELITGEKVVPLLRMTHRRMCGREVR